MVVALPRKLLINLLFFIPICKWERKVSYYLPMWLPCFFPGQEDQLGTPVSKLTKLDKSTGSNTNKLPLRAIVWNNNKKLFLITRICLCLQWWIFGRLFIYYIKKWRQNYLLSTQKKTYNPLYVKKLIGDRTE